MESETSPAPLNQVVGQIENICHQLGNNDPDSSLSVIDHLLLGDHQEAADRLLEIEDSLSAIRAAILPNPSDQRAGASPAQVQRVDGRALGAK